MSVSTLLQLRGLRQPLLALGEALGLAAERSFTTTAVPCRYRSLAPPPVRPPEAPVGAPQPDLVEQYLGEGVLSRAERYKTHMQQVAASYARFPGDTGSTEVQVALLTERIYAMADHMRTHRKDFSGRRGLEAMLSRRRSLLQYLRRTKFDRYSVLLARLGLKDNYAKQDRLTIYKTSSKGERVH